MHVPAFLTILLVFRVDSLSAISVQMAGCSSTWRALIGSKLSDVEMRRHWQRSWLRSPHTKSPPLTTSQTQMLQSFTSQVSSKSRVRADHRCDGILFTYVCIVE